jgi:hypothetical protein
MISLGLQLALDGGREALVRLIVTAIAVALGVGLLLASLASINAVNAQSARGSWLDTQPGSSSGPQTNAHINPIWWLASNDEFEGQTIDRIDVAATGPHSPIPPGLARIPGPGEFFASPALAKLIAMTPATQLGNRIPGRKIGTIGALGLPNPASLIVVVGYSPQQLARTPGAEQVARVATPGSPNGGGSGSEQFLIVLVIGALALLFPVLIFLATATRLAAARREQRMAAMRLVGATPRQVSKFAAVEAVVAAFAGVVLGFVLYIVFRPALQHVSITGAPFAPGDLSLSDVDVLVVAIGVPVAAMVAARLALRQVLRSPLGVSRRVTPPAPKAAQLIPLVVGFVWLVLMVGVVHLNGKGVVYADFVGFLLLMVGLVTTGPWLTDVGARVMARHSNRPAVLLAGQRLSDNPKVAFRSVSGLVLALFVASVTLGIVSTVVADHGAPAGGATAVGTLVDMLGNPDAVSVEGENSIPSLPTPLLGELASIKGVVGVAVVRWDPLVSTEHATDEMPGLVSCAQLTRTPALGHCAPGAAVVTILPFSDQGNGLTKRTTLADTTWPTAALPSERLAALPIEEVVVGTNGTNTAIEQARTDLEVALPYQSYEVPPMTFGEVSSSTSRSYIELQNVTDVVIMASLLIAGCSLAVGVISGISDRRRPFSLLRLTGVPMAVLRRVILLESALPLVVVAVASVSIGLLASELFLKSQLGVTLRFPGINYFLIVVGGLLLSFSIISSTLPLLERITRPEDVRTE